MLLISCSDEENLISGNSDYKFPFEIVITGESNSVSNIPFDITIHPLELGEIENPNPDYKFKFTIMDAQVKNGETLLTNGTWLNYDELTDGKLTLIFNSNNNSSAKTLTITMINSQGYETTQTKSFGITNQELDFEVSLVDSQLNPFSNNVIPYDQRENTLIKVENVVSTNPIIGVKFQSNAILSVNGNPITNSTVIPYGSGVFTIKYKDDSYGVQPINVIAMDQQNNEVTKGLIVDLKYKVFDVNFTWGTSQSVTTNTTNLIEFFVTGNWNSSPYHFTRTSGRQDKYIKVNIQKYDPSETFHVEFTQNPTGLLTYSYGIVNEPLDTNWQGHYILEEGSNYLKIDTNFGAQATTIWGAGTATFKVVSSNGDEKSKTYNINVYLNGSLN
ncbi:hypothetical protein MG290_14600 (plasmid) [Flavobacterium sp. CBA20B-1]|uniref:hypothetical protein n=1 Tax=unclassified Flavobacterium TaxID=196869 RepID=UPI00222510EB|nr:MULTISPECIES: hypothetical protein [unclassified Flavobacterium]WCM43551.1 hypothetical protein MG290_14600 [Flavobacterium sp. CBA20B-1]